MNQADVTKLVSKLRIKVKPEYRRLRNPKGPEGRIDALRKTVTGLIKFERIELNHNRADEARQYAERPKGVPLAKDEVSLLIDLVESNKVVTNKATNASNNHLKEVAWNKIAEHFNASVSSCPRRTDQLKLKWENLKKAARKRSTKIRMNHLKLISEAIRNGDCHKPTMDIADYWLLEKELVHKLFKVLVPRYEHSNTSYTKMYKAPKPQYARVLEKVVLELKGHPYPDVANKQVNNRLLIQNILLDAAKYDYRQSKYAEMAEKIGKTDIAPLQESKEKQLNTKTIES